MVMFKEALSYAQQSTSVDELRLLRQTVQERIDSIGRMKSYEFKQGDRVQFKNRRGEVVHGSFVKRLQKNVMVRADDGVQWRLSSSLLQRENA